MTNIVYIRMKKNLEVTHYKRILLKDIALISTGDKIKHELENMPVYHMNKEDEQIVVIDSFLVIDHLNQQFPNFEFQLIGPEQTIIRLVKKKSSSRIVFIAVWLLLFIGTAMTIINFHYDVSMQEVQQKIHYLLTGEEAEYPLWIQIPYSLGLGVGMLLFLNHWFKKKFNEEPSPLEVELYQYQQSIDQYVSYYENEINDR